ncbi:MAG: efflux RND transporter permease subunit [Bradymonadales bacterium]|nr:efflux RND transporter permease subunit [Bradymonadales bacterium]
MGFVSLAVRRRITVLMIFGALALWAFMISRRIPVDMLPDVEVPYVSIITLWPGASAVDVEENLTNVIEENVGNLANLDEIYSVSRDNLSVVSLAFELGTNLDEATNEVRDALDIASFFLPEGIVDPKLLRLGSSLLPVMFLGVTSHSGELDRYARFIDQQIAQPMGRIPGVGAVIPLNAPMNEVRVEVNPRALADRGLTLEQVGRALAGGNVSAPAGYVEVGEMEYAVRLPGEFQNVSQMEELVVGAGEYGQLIRLKDVATVRLSTIEFRDIAEVRGEEAAILIVQKQSGANTIEVARRVREEAERIRRLLPDDLDLKIIVDSSLFILTMLDNLKLALAFAALFVIVVVMVFVQRIGPSLIISLSIPTSLLFVLLAMHLFGYTINTLTLVAMAVSVGMVVDNSIVVLENIIRHLERGASPTRAAVHGTLEVAPAVLASTLTTVCIFGPLILISGMIGVFATQFSVVVIAALGASLFTAMTLTPMLSAWWLHAVERSGLASPGERIRRFTMLPIRALDSLYQYLLRTALRLRWLVVLAVAVIVWITVVLASQVKIDLLKEIDASEVTFSVALPMGTRVETSAEVGRRIVEILRETPEVDGYFLRAGESPSGLVTVIGEQEGSHIVEISLRLVPPEERGRTDVEIAADLRSRFEDWPDVVSVSTATGHSMFRVIMGGGRAIQVQVSTPDPDDLPRAAQAVLAILEAIEGVVAPSTTAFDARPELRLEVNRDQASELGVPLAYAALALRTAMVGEEVTRIRLHGEDMGVRLLYQRPFRDNVSDLANLEAPSLSGDSVPFASIGEIREDTALIQIRHRNKHRIASIEADVTGRSMGEIIADLEQALDPTELPAGTQIIYGGQIESQQETLADLLTVIIFAIILVYMVMAAQYESLIDPLVIMFSVPFAFTGTFLFLMLTGESLTAYAFLGLIILMGIVVNNGIILVDFINQARQRGLDLKEAILESGRTRLRPVLMTALTTICGAIPLATATGSGSDMWRPVGIAVIGGLLVSTAVTLVVIPVVYRLTEPFRYFQRRKWAKQQEASGTQPGETV